ncbi:MAG: hypothetical protein ABIO75_06475 [Thermomonas sp.]
MALTLGTTGMDSSTQADVTNAFKVANVDLADQWTLVAHDHADYVVVDMDSLYGPMSWLRLHAAGRKVIGLTSIEKSQTDYRLMHPINVSDLTALLSEIAGDAPPLQATAAPAASTPAPAPSDVMPDAQALPEDEVEAKPVDTPAMAAMAAMPAIPDITAVTAVTAELDSEPVPASEPVAPLPPDRSLASWLSSTGLQRRVRLQRGDSPVLLIDPRSKVYHGPATLKPLVAYFEGTLLLEDFETPDAAVWEAEAAELGAAQPLARLKWLGGLLAGDGQLTLEHDDDGQYRLTKWPQTEREYPKHFRIATAMMKGPANLDEVAAASGVERSDVADFVNANLATGYAERVLPPAPEVEQPAKPGGGLFGRMRGR